MKKVIMAFGLALLCHTGASTASLAVDCTIASWAVNEALYPLVVANEKGYFPEPCVQPIFGFEQSLANVTGRVESGKALLSLVPETLYYFTALSQKMLEDRTAAGVTEESLFDGIILPKLYRPLQDRSYFVIVIRSADGTEEVTEDMVIGANFIGYPCRPEGDMAMLHLDSVQSLSSIMLDEYARSKGAERVFCGRVEDDPLRDTESSKTTYLVPFGKVEQRLQAFEQGLGSITTTSLSQYFDMAEQLTIVAHAPRGDLGDFPAQSLVVFDDSGSCLEGSAESNNCVSVLDMAAAFSEGYDKALQFMRENPDESVDLLMEVMKNEEKIDLYGGRINLIAPENGNEDEWRRRVEEVLALGVSGFWSVDSCFSKEGLTKLSVAWHLDEINPDLVRGQYAGDYPFNGERPFLSQAACIRD